MSLTVTRAKVKEMCGISDSTYDTPIDNLIADVVPVVEYAIKAEFLSGSPAGLQSTLDLAAAEIVAGEFVAQLSRTPGYAEKIQIGDLVLEPFLGAVGDPATLKAQGYERLRPYLKAEVTIPSAPVRAVIGKRAEESP